MCIDHSFQSIYLFSFRYTYLSIKINSAVKGSSDVPFSSACLVLIIYIVAIVKKMLRNHH